MQLQAAERPSVAAVVEAAQAATDTLLGVLASRCRACSHHLRDQLLWAIATD